MSPKSQGPNDILRDDNYFLWEFGARMALARKDLLDHVDLKTDESAQRETPAWKVADMKALGVLVKLLGPNYQTMIRETTSAAQAWGVLREFFVKQNLHNRVQLRKELHDFRMVAGCNLMDHLMAFDDICLRLTAVGESLAEDERIVILLGSLPEEYDGMVKIIEAHGNVSLLEAKEMLRREFTSLQKREKGEAAFQATSQQKQGGYQNNRRGNRNWRGNGGGRGRGGRGRGGRGPCGGRSVNSNCGIGGDFQGKCFGCGKFGHKRSDCPQQTRQGNDEEFLFSAAETLPGSWLLDSGASSHMTGDMEDFEELEELSGSLTITVANGERLPVRAKGKVKFVLGDGKSVCMTDVLYIPGISRKLISVSALAAKGVLLSFGSDECVISHGGNIVSRVKKQGRLYIWNMTVQKRVDEVAASSVAGASANVWHARLGHIPIARMNKVAKVVDGVRFDARRRTMQWVCLWQVGCEGLCPTIWKSGEDEFPSRNHSQRCDGTNATFFAWRRTLRGVFR